MKGRGIIRPISFILGLMMLVLGVRSIEIFGDDFSNWFSVILGLLLIYIPYGYLEYKKVLNENNNT